MTIISTTVGKNHLKKWSSHHSQQNSKMQGCNLKNDNMISIHFQGKSFNITVIQGYALISNAEEAEVEQFYDDLQHLLELKPKKDILFIIGNWNIKVGSQETPGVTGKFSLLLVQASKAKSNRVLPREHSCHNKHPLPIHKRRLHNSSVQFSHSVVSNSL